MTLIFGAFYLLWVAFILGVLYFLWTHAPVVVWIGLGLLFVAFVGDIVSE